MEVIYKNTNISITFTLTLFLMAVIPRTEYNKKTKMYFVFVAARCKHNACMSCTLNHTNAWKYLNIYTRHSVPHSLSF